MVEGRQAPIRVGLIGECMIELSRDRDGVLQQGFGGDSLNTAVYLARLSQPATLTTHYVTALGQDLFSQRMLTAWRSEGIDCQHVAQLPEKLPGLYSIQVDEQGERTFYYWRSDAAARELMRHDGTEAMVEALADFEVLYLSGISLAILAPECRQKLIALLARARSRGTKVVFDSNYRPGLWSMPAEAKAWYAEVLGHCDIALLTLEDEQLLYGDIEVTETLARSHELGVEEVVIKRGAEDCLVSTSAGLTSVPAQKVSRVVDTTSAGDSFNAGYLAARFSGASAVEAAKLGHLTAATVIQHPGALTPPEAMVPLVQQTA